MDDSLMMTCMTNIHPIMHFGHENLIEEIQR
jgi:hypothetical protein